MPETLIISEATGYKKDETGAFFIEGDLYHDGDVIVRGSLDVEGDLGVRGCVKVFGDLNVECDVFVKDFFCLKGDLGVGGTINVLNYVSVRGDLDVDGDVFVKDSLEVRGDLKVGGNLISRYCSVSKKRRKRMNTDVNLNVKDSLHPEGDLGVGAKSIKNEGEMTMFETERIFNEQDRKNKIIRAACNAELGLLSLLRVAGDSEKLGAALKVVQDILTENSVEPLEE